MTPERWEASRPVEGSAGPSLIGRRLGSYAVHSLLGQGGMGDVYRAHDVKLGRDVARATLSRIACAQDRWPIRNGAPMFHLS